MRGGITLESMTLMCPPRQRKARARLLSLLAAAVACHLAAGNVVAGETRAGADLTFDRDSQDLALPSATKVKLKLSHGFSNGITLGGSVEITDRAFSRSESENVEATLGYRLCLTDVLSVSTTAGLGERFRTQSDGGNFPYYQVTIAGDITLDDRLTWNAVSLRYRNAFDTANDYETPQIATGLTFQFVPKNWVSLKLSRSRKDGVPSSTGFAIGYQFAF
jgi:hypothetical protein